MSRVLKNSNQSAIYDCIISLLLRFQIRLSDPHFFVVGHLVSTTLIKLFRENKQKNWKYAHNTTSQTNE